MGPIFSDKITYLMNDIILKYDQICLTHKYIDSWFFILVWVLVKLYKIISYIYRQWNWKKNDQKWCQLLEVNIFENGKIIESFLEGSKWHETN